MCTFLTECFQFDWVYVIKKKKKNCQLFKVFESRILSCLNDEMSKPSVFRPYRSYSPLVPPRPDEKKDLRDPLSKEAQKRKISDCVRKGVTGKEVEVSVVVSERDPNEERLGVWNEGLGENKSRQRRGWKFPGTIMYPGRSIRFFLERRQIV